MTERAIRYVRHLIVETDTDKTDLLNLVRELRPLFVLAERGARARVADHPRGVERLITLAADVIREAPTSARARPPLGATLGEAYREIRQGPAAAMMSREFDGGIETRLSPDEADPPRYVAVFVETQ